MISGEMVSSTGGTDMRILQMCICYQITHLSLIDMLFIIYKDLDGSSMDRQGPARSLIKQLKLTCRLDASEADIATLCL